MSRIIIGIHGMGNKPEAKLLKKWWKKAIVEGLERKRFSWFLNFKLVYWSSVLHPEPLDSSCKDKKDPLYLKEPYEKGHEILPPPHNNDIKKWLRKKINDQLDRIFQEKNGKLNLSGITDFIIQHFVKDLDMYYSDIPHKMDMGSSREKICQKLAKTLKKYKRKEILLIAHSMGSIITWDVLTQYAPDARIHTLVTIGSPLGFPVVQSRIRKNDLPLETPSNITKYWYNLADFKDIVAMNYDFESDFLPNKNLVQPKDILVHNNYIYGGEENHHKSYGYLRCPEMGKIISSFIKRAN